MRNWRKLLSACVLLLIAIAAVGIMRWSYYRGASLDVWVASTVEMARQQIGQGDIQAGRGLLDRIVAIDPARGAFELGRFHRDGLLGANRPAPDLKTAEEFFVKAADGGTQEVEAKALLNLGSLGKRIGYPEAKIRELLQRASDLGSRRASTVLAEGLLVSGGRKDKEVAMRLLWKASWSDPEASLALARLYMAGAETLPSLRALGDLVDRTKRLLLDGAEAGELGEMLRLGRFLQGNDVGQQDLQAALMWFETAAAAGSVEALVAAAQVLLADDTRVRDPVRATELLGRAAEAGSAEAAYRLGVLYIEGDILPFDPTSARKMFEQAASHGSVAAILALAKPLLQGHGPALTEGIGLLRRASEGGSATAALLLAELAESGRPGTVDLSGQAREWYQLAAHRGNKKAMARLAIGVGRRGENAISDPDRELLWVERSLQAGRNSTSMMLRLGRAYLEGLEGKPVDLQRAALWFRRAAENGSTTGMIRTAEAYANGGGLPVDPERAVYWYERAAQNGSLKAVDELARAYASGFGVRLDPAEAYKLFRQAATSGSVFGMRETGRALSIGFGVEPNPAKALEYYEAAAFGGDTDAMRELAYAYIGGHGTSVDKTKAITWLTRGALMSDKNAQFLLGRAYVEGADVPKDMDEGVRWLRSAADLGSGDAARLLNDLTEGARKGKGR